MPDVLITGGSGFVAAATLRRLRELCVAAPRPQRIRQRQKSGVLLGIALHQQALHHLHAEHQQIFAVERRVFQRQRHRRRGVERQPLVKPGQRLEELLPVHLGVGSETHVDPPVRLIHPVDA